MHNIFRRLPLAVAISLALPALALAQEATLDRVVVTAPVTDAPLTVTTDPRAPRQPVKTMTARARARKTRVVVKLMRRRWRSARRLASEPLPGG